MTREINPKLDALFVEGPDDGAVVNAFVKRRLELDLAEPRRRLVRTDAGGGGSDWAMREFELYVSAERPGARVGLIVDRDGVATRSRRSSLRRSGPCGRSCRSGRAW